MDQVAIGTVTPPDEYISSLVKNDEERNIHQSAASLHPQHHGQLTPLPELDAAQLTITRNPSPKSVPAPDSPEVAAHTCTTDHMLTASWTASHGWSAPAIVPYGPLSLMPNASCLHYATECFEGLKLYRGYDGRLRLFRPGCNAARMLQSATRIALPAFPPAQLEALIKRFCALEGPKWLPHDRPGAFLYLRPTFIANHAGLGVQRPSEALLYVFASLFPHMDGSTSSPGHSSSLSSAENLPCASKPRAGIRLLASKDDMCRAWPGGFGYAKVGANYGPTLAAQGEARARGYDQILWLFGSEGWVTEAGASNFFVVWRTRESPDRPQLVTASLDDGMILPGVTRRSVLELARERLGEDLDIVERRLRMSEIVDAVTEGRLLEAFAAGTAFFIAPVSTIHYHGVDLAIPMSEGVAGRYALQFRQWLQDIKYGVVSHPWGVVVEEEVV